MKLLYEKNKYKIYKVIILMMGNFSPSLGIKILLKFFLASICFQKQLPVSYRYLKGLSPRSSERDAVSRPRRRHQEKELLCYTKQLNCFLESSSKSCLWYTKSNPSVYQHMSASECITALLLHAYQTARLAVTFLVFHLSVKLNS